MQVRTVMTENRDDEEGKKERRNDISADFDRPAVAYLHYLGYVLSPPRNKWSLSIFYDYTDRGCSPIKPIEHSSITVAEHANLPLTQTHPCLSEWLNILGTL